MRISSEATVEQPQAALKAQGYGVDNPDIIENHPHVKMLRDADQETEPVETAPHHSAKDIAEIGSRALGQTIKVDIKTGLVLLENDVNALLHR